MKRSHHTVCRHRARLDGAPSFLLFGGILSINMVNPHLLALASFRQVHHRRMASRELMVCPPQETGCRGSGGGDEEIVTRQDWVQGRGSTGARGELVGPRGAREDSSGSEGMWG